MSWKPVIAGLYESPDLSGYLTAETDPAFTAWAAAKTLSDGETDILRWDATGVFDAPTVYIDAEWLSFSAPFASIYGLNTLYFGEDSFLACTNTQFTGTGSFFDDTTQTTVASWGSGDGAFHASKKLFVGANDSVTIGLFLGGGDPEGVNGFQINAGGSYDQSVVNLNNSDGSNAFSFGQAYGSLFFISNGVDTTYLEIDSNLAQVSAKGDLCVGQATGMGGGGSPLISPVATYSNYAYLRQADIYLDAGAGIYGEGSTFSVDSMPLLAYDGSNVVFGGAGITSIGFITDSGVVMDFMGTTARVRGDLQIGNTSLSEAQLQSLLALI